MASAVIAELNIYPVKSCGGIALQRAQLGATGLQDDRRWMLVDPQQRFVTQRELPRMALLKPRLEGIGAVLTAPGMPHLRVPGTGTDMGVTVNVWRDTCAAFDEGDAAAEWLTAFLQQPVRLVRFDAAQRRLSDREWTGDIEAPNQFSDGYPMLTISNASLADLNGRLPQPLPMNRFRPNLVLDGVQAYDEDRIHELRAGAVCLRIVKPCTRCRITTTDQSTGIAQPPEPLNTLRGYRWNAQLKGVLFGQNMVIVDGVGTELRVGQELEITWK